MFRLVVMVLLPAVVLSGMTASERNNINNDHIPIRDAFRVVAGSNLYFTNALYEVLSKTEGNLFFSPMSIQVILALTAQGARGTTQQEMIDGLRLPQDQETTRFGFKRILNVIKTNDGESVKIANKIYIDSRYTPRHDFVQIALQSFESDGAKVNFQTQYGEARRSINKWVEENTGNKIRGLLPEGSLGRDTVMVLVNAVYFKGTWSVQFNPENTKPKTFYIKQGEERSVRMMHVKEGDRFFYKDVPELKARVLEMPYIGESMSFVIILPNEKFGLQDVESELARTDLRQLFKNMRTPEIHLWMPKFKLEQTVDLNSALEQMGMRQMFSNSANFSGLAAGPLKVSKVAHKSYIDVNEEGAEAAATTAVHSVLLSAVPDEVETIDFIVDHPFLFILRHSRTNSILFMGRYARPT